MAPREPREKPSRKIHLEFTRASIVLWSMGLFFLLAWIFVLGIMVGRGFIPEGINTLTEMKAQMARLQEIMSRKDRTELDTIPQSGTRPRLEFLDTLEGHGSESAGRDPGPKPPSGGRGSDEGKDRIAGHPPTEPDRPRPGSDRDAGAPHDPSAAPPPASEHGYVVQVASVEREDKATAMSHRLVSLGYPAYTYRVPVHGRTYYRVRCGLFSTRDEAERVQDRLLAKEKIDGFVTRVGD